MGIVIIKVFKRFTSLCKIFLLKSLYLNKIKIGRGVIFYPDCHVTIEKNAKILIGKHCFFNHGCSLNSMNSIAIGNDCIFGENVKIYDHNHNYKDTNTLIRKQKYSISAVKIGNNCWVGSNTIILPGVSIGNNVVIAAGSIVTKDIENNTVYKNDISINKRMI